MKSILTSVSFLLSLGVALAAPAPAPGFQETRSTSLVRRNYTDLYADQLVDGTACRDVTVIYARGTDQEGNIGEPTDVGPEFLDDLGVYVGINNLAAQGVNYSADVTGFEEGGDPTGSALMANLTNLAYEQCPDTLLVLSGYSQGGQLVHNAADLLSTEVTDFVAAVLIFGDPDDGEDVGDIPSSKVHVICHPLDGICKGTSIVTPAHLDYQEDSDAAAQWVAGELGYSVS
ncbi:family 5 carbohydrate esterase [Cryphonectria parasitica EP155]|uniref:Cutinase n=1 Tax=Cryphonectria parasitica (strain ATCC 38755 / EP155) TaxID=660469 RepID=A0A9P4XTB0_CRYP1|nr:family 5 carbohydrate esterase [Cryphonectria parasitica EP155]KAF3760528.1 family 5 carbohydrate esterase [Cryphonectria parasitica EP155]